MTIKQQRTKSGQRVQVLYLDAEDLVRDAEARAYEASELATAEGCAHWRIVDTTGQMVQHGTAVFPLLTHEQAAARSGPAEERHDW